jgi:hypothetical protein
VADPAEPIVESAPVEAPSIVPEPLEDSGAHRLPPAADAPPPPQQATSRSIAFAEAFTDRMRTSLEEAKRSLKRRRADWDRVVSLASLTAVEPKDPVADLATRLDREALFWRTLALSHMKPGVPRYLAMGAAALGLGGGSALTALAGLRAFFSTNALPAGAWTAILALAVSVALVLAAATWLQRTTNRAAADALARGDAAERRLHEVAALLALRNSDEKAFRDAVQRYVKSDPYPP